MWRRLRNRLDLAGVTLVFISVLLGHFLYVTRNVSQTTPNSAWVEVALDMPEHSKFSFYLESRDYWLGASYAAAGAFATWCFLRIVRMRRKALVANSGALTISGLLWESVCFLTGCCGSPMLPIYVGLFGPSIVQSTKPLTFLITLISLLVGFVWMMKRAPKTFAGQ